MHKSHGLGMRKLQAKGKPAVSQTHVLGTNSVMAARGRERERESVAKEDSLDSMEDEMPEIDSGDVNFTRETETEEGKEGANGRKHINKKL